MKMVAYYDFNNGKSAVESLYPAEYAQILEVIAGVDAASLKTKVSTEKTMPGKLLYDPKALNKAFKAGFGKIGWTNHREKCDYTYGTYLQGYRALPKKVSGAFRDMDFVKPGRKLGVEVQFGKYAFMVYNVCAKMTIFSKFGVIDTGIEIVPTRRLANEMSTGVSYFEQFAWDLEHRGTSNIDIPVLIIGVDE